MSQEIRRRKRLWTDVKADGRKETRYKETVTMLPEPTQEFRDGWERIWGNAGVRKVHACGVDIEGCPRCGEVVDGGKP